MRKICILLTVALLFCMGLSAHAEDGVRVELIKMDGISVVALIPEEKTIRAPLLGVAEPEDGEDSLTLPKLLTQIEDEAFAGVAAEKVEVSENVVSIGARAFADCENLREIVIPPNVLTVDESALVGCKNVTVYGEKGSAAEAFVAAANEADPDADFLFAELKPEPIEAIIVQKLPPVVLPFVSAA